MRDTKGARPQIGHLFAQAEVIGVTLSSAERVDSSIAESPLVFTIRTPRASVCTADASSALEHFREASEKGLRPVVSRLGGRALRDKEMERYAALTADAFRIGLRRDRPD